MDPISTIFFGILAGCSLWACINHVIDRRRREEANVPVLGVTVQKIIDKRLTLPGRTPIRISVFLLDGESAWVVTPQIGDVTHPMTFFLNKVRPYWSESLALEGDWDNLHSLQVSLFDGQDIDQGLHEYAPVIVLEDAVIEIPGSTKHLYN